ncbi:hypothetical protein ACCO45_009693 [Purpureocillium lilacinum]|uniref:Uncharacterized protein n=1 Tax=Purpureocillium lilacinum TaxID=33203 RepID=A0ACC4DL56_PURLI
MQATSNARDLMTGPSPLAAIAMLRYIIEAIVEVPHEFLSFIPGLGAGSQGPVVPRWRRGRSAAGQSWQLCVPHVQRQVQNQYMYLDANGEQQHAA